MVFYTCSGCGESLKKNKVEKHVYTCRGCEYLTCIDCSCDFYGDDYKNHTSCITEDQKYSAKGSEFKPKKGDVKQQQWLQNIDSVIASDLKLSDKAKNLITNLKNYDNIPRKRPKFLNFVKNSLRIYDGKLGEEVWDAFSAANKKPAPETNGKNQTNKNDEKMVATGLENSTSSNGETLNNNTSVLEKPSVDLKNSEKKLKKSKKKKILKKSGQVDSSVTEQKNPDIVEKTDSVHIKKKRQNTEVSQDNAQEILATENPPRKKKKKNKKKLETTESVQKTPAEEETAKMTDKTNNVMEKNSTTPVKKGKKKKRKTVEIIDKPEPMVEERSATPKKKKSEAHENGLSVNLKKKNKKRKIQLEGESN